MSIDASLLVIMGIFWITYLILRFGFFKPMLRLLDERARRIEAARALHEAALATTAERVAAQRARLQQARAEAAARRDGFRREAQERRQALLQTARTEARAELEAAQSELDQTVARERRTLGERARQLAELVAARLLGRAPRQPREATR